MFKSYGMGIHGNILGGQGIAGGERCKCKCPDCEECEKEAKNFQQEKLQIKIVNLMVVSSAVTGDYNLLQKIMM
jgi:hypothetical protein